MRQIGIVFTFLLLSFLTGCWSNQELNHSTLVHGVGFDTKDDQLRIALEIVQPSSNGSGSEDVESQGSGEHIILEEDTDTLLEGARELIKYTKRRLDFGHTKVWIITEDLAKEDFISTLGLIRRDQMLRLNSHIFITKDNPTDILNTPTMYEHLVASELDSSLNQTQYVAEYAPITMREFYKLIEGPIPNAYIPMLYLEEVNKQKVTALDGVAVIKKDRMVGELDRTETAGLNILLNHVKGGNIQVNLNDEEKISLEIATLKTKLNPTLNGSKVDVAIQVEMEGTLADNMTPRKINESFLKEIETALEEKIEATTLATLNTLQEDLQTDITNIGLKTYRKYPRQWKKISSKWDEIFAGAEVSIEVDTNVLHQGLINESVNRHKTPHNNPYRFSK